MGRGRHIAPQGALASRRGWHYTARQEASSTVTLRRLEAGDLDVVHSLVSRMDVVRYMCFPRCSRAESGNVLGEWLTESPHDPWRSIGRAIVDSRVHRIVGLCGIVIPRGAEEGEIWYLVEPESWGRGIAGEAARQLLEFGFGELGLHRIWASCLPENPASVRVLEKIGMRREGLLRNHLKIHGEWKSSYLYAILVEEWSAAAAPSRACAGAATGKA